MIVQCKCGWSGDQRDLVEAACPKCGEAFAAWPSKLVEFVYELGPDNDRETELKRKLHELQKRYREEAQPLLEALTQEHSLKVPRIRVRRA